jgi:hypothetical protein
MFMSGIVKIGHVFFKSYNLGGFLLVIIQMILCAVCLSYSIKIINKFKIHPCIKWIVLLIYSVATIYPRYLTAIVKDSLFSCFVVLFVSVQIDIFILKNNKTNNYLSLFLVSFLISILRSNGIFIIYFCLVAIIVFYIKNKRKTDIILGITLLLVIFVYRGYLFITESNGAKKAPVSEALSIPFQQTARYIKNFHEDVTNEEKEIINKVLDYEIKNKILLFHQASPKKQILIIKNNYSS